MRALFVALAAAAALPGGIAAQKTITLEEIFAPAPPQGLPPKDVRLSADGERVLVSEPEPRPAAEAGRPAAGPPPYRVVLRNAVTGARLRLPFRVDDPQHVAFAPVGHRLYLLRATKLYSFDDDAGPQPVLDAKQPFDRLRRLAGGSLLAQAGGDHWTLTAPMRHFAKLALPEGATIVAKARAARRYLFRVGDPVPPVDGNAAGGSRVVTFGWLDGRRELHFTLPGPPRRIAFAPDGAAAAFVTLDQAVRGPPQLVPDYLTKEVTVRKGRSGRPGDPPRLARLHLVRFRASPPVALLPLHPGKPPAALPVSVPSLEFGPRGRRLLVQTIGASGHVRRLLVLDRRKPREVELVYEEVDDRWIGPLARAAFFDATGRGVVFTSEADGTARVYHVEIAPGARPQPITPKGVLVDACMRTPGGRVLASLAHPDPARRFLAVVDPERRTILYPDQPAGWNEAPVLAAAAPRIAFLHSRLYRPPEVWTTQLGRIGKGRQLTHLTPASFLDYRWVRPEFVRYRSPDKTWVHAQLFMPKGRRPPRGWPAVIFLHGAGYLQNVRDSLTAYPSNLLFHHRLAERGYVVLAPDFRGSKGYGRKFRTDVYKDLGGPDREDVVAARRYLFDHCGVDLAKIGVYGGSYGGFLTLMCLFKEPKAFACGAALRPVTDWTRYQPAYTERRLGSPQDPGGAEVYRRTSPIRFAEGLARPLLLLHGMRDTNVFVQDTLRLVDRLVELGKDFDAMIYPSQGHAFRSSAAWVDEYRRIERLFDRVLK